MGEGDSRHSKRAVRYDSRELARLSKQHVPTEAEWDAKVAAAAPTAADLAAMARTATLDDPLTTSLLAEVARRSQTVEVSPEQVDEARATEAGERDPSDDPT
jgi:hypothetical protein